jgi:hypothetical protein
MDDPERAPVIARDMGREDDLVPLRRPASVAEVELHPGRRDLPQAAPVELDGEERIRRLIRSREDESFAVRRVVARTIVAAGVGGDPSQVAAVRGANCVDPVERGVAVAQALAGEPCVVG